MRSPRTVKALEEFGRLRLSDSFFMRDFLHSEIAAIHGIIRERLVERFGPAGQGLRILYGGSVKPDNAALLLGQPNVGGALVGGASLTAASLVAIAEAAG